MDTLRYLIVLGLVIIQAFQTYSQCLRGCSCVSDRQERSLTCMEGTFLLIPENIPEDITKIRIEKSYFTEIPRGAFLSLTALESLWLNFNDITVMNVNFLEGMGNLTELRLQGNKLRSVPWTAFKATRALKILDLKHNFLDVLPEHAFKFLLSLTFLDLSFNKLTIISRDVFINWPLYQSVQRNGGQELGFTPNIVLALHDNTWLCDCRLKGFVEFIRSLSPPIILMNSYLKCAGPDLKAGQFFHELELITCMKPVVTGLTTNISMHVEGNITLHCLAKARPHPTVWWTYGLKLIRGFHESQERVNEDTISAHLEIPSLHLADRGIYTCIANNFIGNSSVSIFLDVRPPDGSLPARSALSPMPAASSEENVYIDIRIARQTVYGITIEWYAVLERPAETWFTVHFGQTDSAKKELIYIGPGINSYTVSDLMPATKYDICVTLKNKAPLVGQCILFMTGSGISELEQREKLIHIVVIVFAMVLAVPAGMYACTTDTKFNCLERVLDFCKNKRWESASPRKAGERQDTFDSLQAASDEGLIKDFHEEKIVRRRSDDQLQKSKSNHIKHTEVY
ncbi:leucine-rich repeat, immunoglobulin-like domain and transmembrane domain-containing protein 2 [Osmerus mordax]|uniref:leucine-rich repeat, immunoglobulin-like domain and transmembrane domain-containing protein 2 n=1 Tax=Osmerus mordax TaxID=8014 RepID=UPI00350EBDE0